MPEFINCLNPLSHSHTSIEMDSADLSQSSMGTETLACFNLFHDQPSDFQLLPLADKLPSYLPVELSKPAAEAEAGKKRKPAAAATETGSLERDQEKAKRGKKGSKEGEKAKEVVHVRARRGQATDSHSLAERVRRERINEKMRCLQDLVPGCYKTMGMATMLDEIINYVQSLQNQVEFLSMKLFAASSIYDFNMEVESMAEAQQVRNVDREARALEVLEREVGYGCLTTLNSALPF